LALIETILDAARVEAGQLQLMKQPMAAADVINDAIIKARDLHGPQHVDVAVELPQHMPPLDIDPQYGARAVAVLIGHAMDTAIGARGRAVRIRMGLPATGDTTRRAHMARLHIEFVSQSNRPSLLEAQLQGKLHSSSGRGMVLRLSLARAVIELHGGEVEVTRGTHGAAVVTCWLPMAHGQPLPRYEHIAIEPALIMPNKGRE
jgi:K+-sensing histidine kinase KdpD